MADLPEHIQAVATGGMRGRVGHKAGGFIAKKRFHPSSFANQELLWNARDQARREKILQDEYSKKREEERKLELLRENVFNTTGAVGPLSAVSEEELLKNLSPEQSKAACETKKRLLKLRNAHSQVWGSYFAEGKWGYGCCRSLERGESCTKRKI